MSAHRHWMPAGAAMALVAVAASCASTSRDDLWVYAASREAYLGSDPPGDVLSAMFTDGSNAVFAGIVLGLYALPFAVDTALLPVTVPHDTVCVIHRATESLFGGAPRSPAPEPADLWQATEKRKQGLVADELWRQ